MHKLIIPVAAVALISGVSLAAAADGSMSKNSTSTSALMSSQSKANGSLSLSSADQKTAWKNIIDDATKQKVPSGFTAKVGETLPSGIDTHPVPVSTADKVPELKTYQYALLENNKLLIVDPADKKIVDVITQ